jgi:hypothetical protein
LVQLVGTDPPIESADGGVVVHEVGCHACWCLDVVNQLVSQYSIPKYFTKEMTSDRGESSLRQEESPTPYHHSSTPSPHPDNF